jgi:hypothetical protein
MLNRFHTAALLATTASVAAAQTELCIVAETTDGTNWALTAELLNPTGTVLAVIADLGFTFQATNIGNFEYNSAFDSDFFGDATVSVTSTSVDFLGSNTLPPLNNGAGVDSSNPLVIATFTADSIDEHSFDLIGQVTGAYAGVPFPQILFYQNADGNAGDTAWTGFKVLPAPSTASLMCPCGLAASRRRR